MTEKAKGPPFTEAEIQREHNACLRGLRDIVNACDGIGRVWAAQLEQRTAARHPVAVRGILANLPEVRALIDNMTGKKRRALRIWEENREEERLRNAIPGVAFRLRRTPAGWYVQRRTEGCSSRWRMASTRRDTRADALTDLRAIVKDGGAA